MQNSEGPAGGAVPAADTQLTTSSRKVSAQVYEPVIDHSSSLYAEDSELTPIFHALASRVGDPSDDFRRDPLAAPLPSSAPPPALTRMLLSAVPGHGEAVLPGGGADTAAQFGDAPTFREVAAGSGGGRGGRHRALRSVGHGPFGQ